MEIRVDAEHAAKVDAGLVEGNLKHMLDRVSGFQKHIQERKQTGKPIIQTRETVAHEKQAKELEKFMDFCGIFGNFQPILCEVMKEVGVISKPKEFKYDIFEYTEPDGKVMQEIRWRNIQIWWPISVLRQVYALCERKVTLT
jgi:hypothetical protein